MGIRGLRRILKQKSLVKEVSYSDTVWLIDGRSFLYLFMEPVLFKRGGEYGKLLDMMAKFFDQLKSCGISAIVLMNGAKNDRTFDKKIKRFENRAKESQRFSNDGVLPSNTQSSVPLLNDAFISFFHRLGVPVFMTPRDVVAELLFLSQKFGWPILANDSMLFFGYTPVILLESTADRVLTIKNSKVIVNQVDPNDFSNSYRIKLKNAFLVCFHLHQFDIPMFRNMNCNIPNTATIGIWFSKFCTLDELKEGIDRLRIPEEKKTVLYETVTDSTVINFKHRKTPASLEEFEEFRQSDAFRELFDFKIPLTEQFHDKIVTGNLTRSFVSVMLSKMNWHSPVVEQLNCDRYSFKACRDLWPKIFGLMFGTESEIVSMFYWRDGQMTQDDAVPILVDDSLGDIQQIAQLPYADRKSLFFKVIGFNEEDLDETFEKLDFVPLEYHRGLKMILFALRYSLRNEQFSEQIDLDRTVFIRAILYSIFASGLVYSNSPRLIDPPEEEEKEVMIQSLITHLRGYDMYKHFKPGTSLNYHYCSFQYVLQCYHVLTALLFVDEWSPKILFSCLNGVLYCKLYVHAADDEDGFIERLLLFSPELKEFETVALKFFEN